MKPTPTTFLLVVLLVLSTLAAHAQTIRRVNNTGITGTNIYTTLQAAHDAAASGDFIYLEPNDNSYGNLTCTKQLTIIGTGYFLEQNPGLQLDKREATVGAISFNSSSAGSRITGCTIASTLYVGASNMIVERNYLRSVLYIGYSGSEGYTSVANTVVRQNYINSNLSFFLNTNSVTNTLIANNIIVGGIGGGNNANLTNTVITNNAIGSATGNNGAGIDVNNTVIKNNILTSTSANIFTLRNNAVSYNISAGAQFGTGNGNQQNVSATSLFVGGTASTDGAYQLRTGTNPARGAGENGTDVGPFGGATPYRVAGIPNVPTIYQYNQTVSGNTLNATISTRSNN
ncbi:hypothetical protein H8B15_12520 [Hymenobacter sp. BT507]|uniref:Right-handed parallel beta-helix repeat-containing protein n=1 Tax=Hymenobacter citatus TaxID=2763506 RepID=A0ABR7ML24_9BACT|nr:hypothetical protein [Hymenobacter citatus]MBC6611751.1 hypothetical protein [Hymenobacter citatus]